MVECYIKLLSIKRGQTSKNTKLDSCCLRSFLLDPIDSVKFDFARLPRCEPCERRTVKCGCDASLTLPDTLFQKNLVCILAKETKKKNSFDVSAKAITWRAKECRYGGGKGNIQPLAQTYISRDGSPQPTGNEIVITTNGVCWVIGSKLCDLGTFSLSWMAAMRQEFLTVFQRNGAVAEYSRCLCIYIYTYVRCMSVENWQLNGNNTFWILQMNLH